MAMLPFAQRVSFLISWLLLWRKTRVQYAGFPAHLTAVFETQTLLLIVYLPCPSRTFDGLIPGYDVRNREAKSQQGCSVRLLPYYPVTTPGVCPVQMLADDLDIYGSP